MIISPISSNIISPLGFSSQENFENVRDANIHSTLHEKAWGLPEPFFGSLIDWERVEAEFEQLPQKDIRYTRLEKISILSAYYAIQKAGIDPTDSSVLFVFSTTKGNVFLWDEEKENSSRVELGYSARLIGEYFNNPNPVTVVSNACTSGVAAQLYAAERMRAFGYRYAVVVGADVLCKFIISGFQSFKALSTDRCKPFDKNRKGLNLGEGAATVILEQCETATKGRFVLAGGGNRNDANHISGPSRTGEGLHNAIECALQQYDRSKIAFINAHGTATPYNDDMESWAIMRSQLSDTPTNSLKGYFGHTLGAAGLIECIISSYALREGIILKTIGHEEKGVVNDIRINTETTPCQGTSFLKIISGFGGSNAAILYELIQ